MSADVLPLAPRWRALVLMVSLGAVAACGGDGPAPTPTPVTPSPVSVGGTVTGLRGSGLVLQNNGANDLAVVASDTAFQFSNVAANSAYSVTVKTQPSTPTQACTVNNGAGTAGTTNVRSVAVSCATSSFVVRGTVSGLTANGLTLLLNGGSTQTLAAGATTFAFPATPSGAAFTVSIGSQPVGQVCTVASGTGTIGAADVTTVAVTCTTNSYVVRGTISRLTATGLTLLLNGGSTQTLAAGATSFAFPATLSGTAYTVTVGTQPAGQACTVANGAGTISGADVSNVAVTCVNTGLTVGGTVLTLAASGLTLRLNGGTPLAIASGASAFSFASLLQPGDDYAITMDGTPTGPLHSCLLNRARGRVASTAITDPLVRCFSNSGLAALGGVYEFVVSGRRSYVALWTDGTYSLALRNDEPTCTNNGNGVEYGVYKRATDGSYFIHFAIDNTGGCGLWGGGSTPGQGGGASGVMTRSGNTFTASIDGFGTLVSQAVASVSSSLVGAWMRADGRDGGFLVFANDGTYLVQQAQPLGGALSASAGWERGCYVISGSTFTTSLAASCKPDGFAATDLNGVGGFSSTNGAPIAFTITGANTVTIGGVNYVRILPEG
jgi:hypothetical protein